MRLLLRCVPRPGWLKIFPLLGLVMVCAGHVHATTLIVTSTADSGAGSLREAIDLASDGDRIQFDAALNGQAITLSSDRLSISKDITISGPGPSQLTVAKTPVEPPYFGIFYIAPGHTATIEGLTISRGYQGGGSGLYNEGSLTLNNCVISDNVSDAGVGGGGIFSVGALTIVNSVVSHNFAYFTTGFPTGYGGGIYSGGSLTIINSAITDNVAAINGGGILGGGAITITDSMISGNRAGSSSLTGSGWGGGIVYNSDQGMLVIHNSTISSNTASGDQSGAGGGIGISDGGSVAISNCTISGNFADGDGGGISNGRLTITNSTLSGNWAKGPAGGIATGGTGGTLEISNTILKTGVSGANISNNGGTVTSHGHNMSSDNGGGFLTGTADQINTDPMLGPLQDNGGPTFTHEPLSGSPAIDAGDPNFTPPPSFDQRGYPRVFNGRLDIGSLEVQPAPTPTPTPTPSATPTATPVPSPAQALNISTRLRVETGDNVMVGGFIVTGGAPKDVALRGIGPSLGGLGINDKLADPTLELHAANGTLLFQNDNWQDDPAQAAQLTSLGLAPQNPNESGLVATLQPGAYTAILAGKNGGTGVGLLEIYDTTQSAGSQLANISTRGFVQTGDNVMIGGFILGQGDASTAIAVRGIGPSLSNSGLSNLLADPTLELRDSNGSLLISNDNWQDDQVSAAQLAAHGLAPQDPLESGIFASLPPGAFTAILAGKNSGIGLGLVEIYNVH